MSVRNSTYTLGVIIPCWNCEEFINTTIECLLNQTFTDWNAFLVDDKSTDATAEIIQSYASKDNRINYVLRNRNPKGAQVCRNTGLELTEGAKYVVFFDADDIIAPYCFEQRVDFMQKNPSCDFAIFKAKTFTRSIFELESTMYGIDFTDDLLSAMLNWSLPIVGWTNIYKRKSLIDHSIRWDEKILSLQDSDFNIQSLISGMQYMFAKDCKVDYFYRIVESGISKKIKSKAHYDSHLYLLDKTLDTVSKSKRVNDVVLQNNILLFYNLVKPEKEFVKKILRVHWLWDKKCNYLKMWLYILLGGRGKKYLFPRERRFSNDMNQKWHQAIALNISEFLVKSENDILLKNFNAFIKS